MTSVRTLTAILCAGALAGGAAAPASASASASASAAAVRSCGMVAFQANTDFGVFKIRAYGTSCQRARDVARGSRSESIEGVQRYTRYGYSCRGVAEDTDALPTMNWTCRNGGARVTFERN